jgi:ketosteroid isomerase-like protein
MKIRLLLSLAGLALAFAVPTFAQQTSTPDPQLRDALATLTKKIDDAYIKGDAAALAALYTEDATLLRSDGAPIYGRDAIEQYWRKRFQLGHYIKHVSTPDQHSPHIIGTAGNELWSTAHWISILQFQSGAKLPESGYWLQIHVLEGDALKIRVQANNMTF